jgi:hypothetical protein
VAALMLVHQQLDDTAFAVVLLSLLDLARKTGCDYFMDRQMMRACRDDETLCARLARLGGWSPSDPDRPLD